MPLSPIPDVPRPPSASSGGTVTARIWDAARRFAAIAENLRTLEIEDARTQSQRLELSKIVLGLSNDVHELLGQMKAIEQRFDDRDKLLDAMIRLRVAEEMQKLRVELLGKDNPGVVSCDQS
ncbi:MAG TPA: hypothetical protein VMU81_31475 [Acetobacteraceae bacterium]|nr:hypothetical protein [Acetobacteraceae bacterium]